MSIRAFFFTICVGFFSTHMFGQEKGIHKEEIDYIKKWMDNFMIDEEMTPETNERFKIITSYYGLKMKQLGEIQS